MTLLAPCIVNDVVDVRRINHAVRFSWQKEHYEGGG